MQDWSWLLLLLRGPVEILLPAPQGVTCENLVCAGRASLGPLLSGNLGHHTAAGREPLCKVPTWLELTVLPSTGSSTQSFFPAVAVLCQEVLISLAGC